jgi:hypothetical protein
MEPSARNRWQSIANATVAKRLKQADPQPVATQATVSQRMVEGVCGSSPQEGSTKGQQMALFCARESAGVVAALLLLA